MYVDFELSKRAASGIGNIQVWITNQFEHNGTRAAGDEVLGRLIGMLHESTHYFARGFAN